MNIFDRLREKLKENTFTDYSRPSSDDQIITLEDALSAVDELEKEESRKNCEEDSDCSQRPYGTVDDECQLHKEDSKLDRDTEKEALCSIQDHDVQIGRVTFKAGTTLYHCPNCSSGLLYSQKYCGECGQKVRIRRVKHEGVNN